MKILVTGSNGMIGTTIKKYSVKYPNHKFIFLTRKECDLTNQKQVDKFFKNNRIDLIIHLAANVGGLYKNLRNNAKILSDNIKINTNVIDSCNKYNIKKGIFILSSCIFPINLNKFPMDEDDLHKGPPHYSNEGYSYAKRLMEIQCRMYNNDFNRNYICLTPVNLYGPYDNFNLDDSHVIPGLMHRFYLEKIIKDSKYIVFGSGKPLRQFLFSNDFVNIILKLLFDHNGSQKHFICCNDFEITIKEMVFILCKVMNISVDRIIFDDNKSDGCYRKTVSNSKFNKIFPKFKYTKLNVGLKKTYDWFKKNYNNLRQ